MQKSKTHLGYFYRKFPLISILGNMINKNIEEYRLIGGSKKLINDWEAKINVINLNKKTKEILQKSSVLIISNHPTFTEPLAILSILPQRPDAFFLMSQAFLSLSPSFQKHTEPIYMTYEKEGESFLTKLLRRILAHGKIKYKQAHYKNINSIDKAAKRISSGELGIIFPAPLKHLNKNTWKAGLGYLLNSISNPTNVYVVEILVEGTNILDALRSVPFMRRFFGEIKITLRPPIKVSQIKSTLKPKSSKDFVLKLEQDYLNWVKSI